MNYFFKRITKGRNIGISFEEFNIAYRRYIAEMIYSDNSRELSESLCHIQNTS